LIFKKYQTSCKLINFLYNLNMNYIKELEELEIETRRLGGHL
jgi:hypothetical protein